MENKKKSSEGKGFLWLRSRTVLAELRLKSEAPCLERKPPLLDIATPQLRLQFVIKAGKSASKGPNLEH